MLRYIHNKSRAFKTLFANRVAFIRNSTNLSPWYFVPGSLNPADKATRGMTSTDFLACKGWVFGPEFLRSLSDDRPTQPNFLCTIPETDAEVKSKICHTRVASVATVHELLFRYFKWMKLKITVAWLLRYRNNQRRRSGREMKSQEMEPLTVEELQESEIQIIRYEQRKFYVNEIEAFTTGKTVKRNSHLVSLDRLLIKVDFCVLIAD